MSYNWFHPAAESVHRITSCPSLWNPPNKHPVLSLSQTLVLLLKLILARTAHRTHPVIRQFLKRSAGFYAGIRIAFLRVINLTTNSAFVLLHPAPFSRFTLRFNIGRSSF